MAFFDVFNGDADGICALHQVRLHCPRDAVLVTGAKRAIALLKNVEAHAGDSVTVLDVCVDENRSALLALLDAGVRVDYVDHHASQALPDHPLLHATINADPAVCTAVLVDQQLGGRYRRWAIVAAYGDNLPNTARQLAHTLRLPTLERHALRQLGKLLNYNAYGDSVDELIIHPAELYQRLHRHPDPLRFISDEPVLKTLAATLESDLRQALCISPEHVSPYGSMTYLPDAAWSRRVSGTLANHLARDEPGIAHAVLLPTSDKAWRVSVRAPMQSPYGADQLCRRFPSGGGRPAAAGIDALPATERSIFIEAFRQVFAGPRSLPQDLPIPSQSIRQTYASSSIAATAPSYEAHQNADDREADD
ncbi:MAG: acetyltransferase [Burkholderiales bacterium]|nr:acetyltransferase [Burkholderiales bacterium]